MFPLQALIFSCCVFLFSLFINWLKKSLLQLTLFAFYLSLFWRRVAKMPEDQACFFNAFYHLFCCNVTQQYDVLTNFFFVKKWLVWMGIFCISISHIWMIQPTNLTLLVIFSNICTKKGGSEHPGWCREMMLVLRTLNHRLFLKTMPNRWAYKYHDF